MYICLDCDEIFSSPRQYVETHGCDSPPYEASWGCPCCGGAYVETYECSQCGNFIVDDYIELNDGTLICDKCYELNNIQDERYV